MSDLLDKPEDDIIRSWHKNAQPWTQALQFQQIASRRAASDGTADTL